MSGLENERVMFLYSKERREWVRNRAVDVLVGRESRFRVCLCSCDGAETWGVSSHCTQCENSTVFNCKILFMKTYAS